VLPFRIAFEFEISSNVLSTLITIDFSIDVLLILDVGVNALSAYENEEGVFIYTKKQIFLDYLEFWLWIDLVSCFPFYYLTSNTIFQLLRVLKLLRFVTEKRYFNLESLPISGGFHAKVRKFLKELDKNLGLALLKSLYSFFFLMHLYSCLWYYIIQFERPDEVDETWVIIYGLIDCSLSMKYVSALYFTLTVMTTVGYGNITPTTINEKILVIFFMFFGIISSGKVMGKLMDLYRKMNNQDHIYNDRNELINFYALIAGFSRHFNERLLFVFRKMNKTPSLFEQYVDQSFFENHSEIAFSEIFLYIFKEQMEKFVFFQNKPPLFLTRLILLLKTVSYEISEEIYRERDKPSFLYFVLEGQVRSNYMNPEFEKEVLSYGEGSYFGDIECFFHKKSQITIIANSFVVLWQVEAQSLMKLLEEYPEILKEMMKTAEIKKNRLIVKKQEHSQIPARIPMNYWRWKHEDSNKKPNIEKILYRQGEANFQEFGKEHYENNYDVVLKEMEARKLFLENNLNLEIDEKEIEVIAVGKLENGFFFKFFEEDFRGFEFIKEKFKEIKEKLKDVKKKFEFLGAGFQKVDTILGENARILKDVRYLEKLLQFMFN